MDHSNTLEDYALLIMKWASKEHRFAKYNIEYLQRRLIEECGKLAGALRQKQDSEVKKRLGTIFMGLVVLLKETYPSAEDHQFLYRFNAIDECANQSIEGHLDPQKYFLNLFSYYSSSMTSLLHWTNTLIDLEDEKGAKVIRESSMYRGLVTDYKFSNTNVLIDLACIAFCYDTTLADCVGRAYRKLKEK